MSIFQGKDCITERSSLARSKTMGWEKSMTFLIQTLNQNGPESGIRPHTEWLSMEQSYTEVR